MRWQGISLQSVQYSLYQLEIALYSKAILIALYSKAILIAFEQVCVELRKEYPEGLPILMVSASTDEESIVKGLQVRQTFNQNPTLQAPITRLD